MKVLRQIAFYVFLLTLWQLLFSLKLWPQYLFPSPGQVFETLAEGFTNRAFLTAVTTSLRRLIAGYGISALCGVALGLFIGRRKWLEETIGSFLVGLQTLPSICWLPLAMLWFGLNDSAITFVVVMGSFLAIASATDAGVKNIQPIYLKAGKNMGAKGQALFKHVIVPAAFPMILMGLKQGWWFSWRSLMAAEILFAGAGLGHLLNAGRQLNDMSQVLAVMLVVMAVGMVMDKLVFGTMERRVRQWWGWERQT